jgi:hypothetical protein
MAHQTDPKDPNSWIYGHTIGEYPNVAKDLVNGKPMPIMPNNASGIDKFNQSGVKLFGVAGTDSNSPNYEGMGALGGYMKEATNIMDSIYGATVEPTQKEKDINMGRMALKFFTQMGASASQPGQTALGAANVAGANVAQDYLNKIQSDRDKKEKLELAKKTGALTIAGQLKSAQDAKEIALGKQKTDYVPIYKDGNSLNVIKGSPDYIKKITQEDWKLTKPAKAPGFTYKSVDAGIPAFYVKDEAEAAQLLKPYIDAGLSIDSSAYKRIIKTLVAPSDKQGLVGKEIIINDQFGQIKPIQIGDKIGDIVLQGNKDAGVPNFVDFKKEYSKKYGKDFQGTVSTYAEVIPKIQSAMQILIGKNGPDTGKLSEFTLPFKQIINQSLGTVDPNVMNLESLQSIAFYLATKMRPKGSGSTSDMEFRAYMKAALSLGNSAQANYISLYAMKKMKENSEFLNEKSFQLIDSGEVRSISELNSELRKIDTGLFAKFDLKSYDGEIRDNTGKLTPEFIEARQAWEDKLDPGTVAINNGIYDLPNTYVIKNWRTS